MFFKCSYLPKMGRNGPGLCRILHRSGGMEGHLLFFKRNSASIVVSTVNGSFHAVVAFRVGNYLFIYFLSIVRHQQDP